VKYILIVFIATSFVFSTHAKPQKKERINLPATEKNVVATKDTCPIVNQDMPRKVGSPPHTKLIYEFDVNVANEDAFQNCEKKFIRLNLCKESKGTKKIEIRLHSVSEGWQGTTARIIGNCIKQRKPASVFTPQTPIRLERKIKEGENEIYEDF
jgi:hypothetical protein